MIRGCNGAIWICPASSNSADAHAVDTGGYVKSIESVSLDVRKTMVRLSNCIQILNRLGLPIFDTSIMHIYDLSSNYDVHELIEPKVIQNLAKLLRQHSSTTHNEGGEVERNGSHNDVDMHE